MSTIRFLPSMMVPFLALIVRGSCAIEAHDLRHVTYTGDVAGIREWLDQSGVGALACAYQRDNTKAWRAAYPGFAKTSDLPTAPKFTDADLQELVKLVVDPATDWRPIARSGVLLRYNLDGIGGKDALRFCATVVESGIYVLTEGV